MKEKGGVIGRSKTSPGFTLLELMVTIALVAFMALLASTSFDTGSWLGNYRLKAAARDLYSNMQKARISAIKENRPWAVVFNTGSPQSYQLVSSGPNNVMFDGDDVVQYSVTLSTYKSGILYGFGNATKTAATTNNTDLSDSITFNSNGAVFNSQGLLTPLSGYCYLTNDRGDAFAVGALTSGSIRMRKWVQDAWK